MSYVAQSVFAEHQMIADLADGVILTNLPEIPTAICRIAVQTGADQHVILDHQFLVHATDRVGEGDGFSAFAAHEVAGGEQVDAGDFQFGRSHRALIASEAQLREVVGADLGLFEQRRNQAVGDAAMAGAFADCVDARVVGLQGVIDQNPAIAGDAGLFRQFSVGANAGGHHHQVGRDDVAVLELHRADPAIAGVVQGLGLFAQAEMQATGFQRRLQKLAAGLVQLPLQQPFAEVHHGDVHAAQHQAIGRFEAEQAAADDHGVFVGPGGVDHGLGVGDVAITDHALQSVAGDWQDKWGRAGGDQQTVVLGFGAVLGDHPAFDPVDLHDFAVEQQLDVVFQVPVEVVEDDLFEGLLTGQHRRQQDAVVVGVRFGAEDGDVVELVAQLEQFFQGTDPGHAIADHHQFEFFHQVLRELRLASDGPSGLARQILRKQKKASR